MSTKVEEMAVLVEESRMRKLLEEAAKGPQTCCGGIPLNNEGRCPECGDKL